MFPAILYINRLRLLQVSYEFAYMKKLPVSRDFPYSFKEITFPPVTLQFGTIVYPTYQPGTAT